jgi:hypothetical protein
MRAAWRRGEDPTEWRADRSGRLGGLGETGVVKFFAGAVIAGAAATIGALIVHHFVGGSSQADGIVLLGVGQPGRR